MAPAPEPRRSRRPRSPRHGRRGNDRPRWKSPGRPAIPAHFPGRVRWRGDSTRPAGPLHPRRHRARPDRRMNHMPRRQPITPGDFCLAGLTAVEVTTLGQQFGAGRAMDRAIHAAAAQQRRLAALTMASTRSVVMSATRTSSRTGSSWRAEKIRRRPPRA